jgi:hypothetical protein
MSKIRWMLPTSITAGFALALVFLLTAGGLIYQGQVQMAGLNTDIDRALVRLDQTEVVFALLLDAEASQRGYSLTGAERFLAPYEATMVALARERATLHDLCAGDADAQRRLAQLDILIETRLDELRGRIDSRRHRGPDAAPAMDTAAAMDAGAETMRSIRAGIEGWRSAERADLVIRRELRQTRRSRNRVTTAAAILVGALLSWGTLLALNGQTGRRMLAEEERDRSLRAEVATEERALVADALRASEEELRALFTFSPLGKCQADPITGRFLRVNPRLCEITGYTEAELLGMTFPELIAPEDQEPSLARVRHAIESGVGGHARQIRAIRKDGTQIWLQIDISFLEDAEGGVRRTIAVVRDVTANRAAEAERDRGVAELRAARAQAEAANHAKDEFLSVLSHELRAPLHAIFGWLSILKIGLAQGRDVSRAIATVERNVGLQAQLVNDLLDVSRIVSGKLTLAEQAVELTTLVRAAVENASPAAEAKGVALACETAPSSGVVLGEQARLTQVLGNLLNNAIKFTPRGGEVHVTLTSVGGEVTIQIRDTGIGVTPGFLPHVFDRFRQADATSTRAHGGLGIGLYLVKTLVELHKGQIALHSDGTGKGTTVTVHLPVQSLAGAPRSAAVELRAQKTRLLAGIIVLLVDDEADCRDALGVLLRARGAEVHPCESAADATSALDRVRPDVIVSDIGMPGGNGYAFIRSVRARADGQIPAVALTGFASRQDVEEAMRAGFDEHLAKPVRIDVLVARLRDMVGRGPGASGGPGPRELREAASGEGG